MPDKFVTMIDSSIATRVSPSVANFVVKEGEHPRIAASQCAEFAQGYPSAVKLRIVCHGMYAYSKAPVFSIGDTDFGGELEPGMGLKFGGKRYNANLMPAIFSFVYNCFDAIVLVACGAAGTAKKAVPWGPGDGPGLCRALAASANAPVWAADQEQTYDWSMFGGPITLRNWSGNVYIFPPDGTPPSIVIKKK
jgi:hypothetical protein